MDCGNGGGGRNVQHSLAAIWASGRDESGALMNKHLANRDEAVNRIEVWRSNLSGKPNSLARCTYLGIRRVERRQAPRIWTAAAEEAEDMDNIRLRMFEAGGINPIAPPASAIPLTLAPSLSCSANSTDLL